jgi:menaquinone-dependent protoporphyrinogen oxidase
MSEEMSRREFVRLGVCVGVGVATAGVAGCGPKKDETSVETPSSSYAEENTMGQRVLVGYATGKGSTVGVAEAIGKQLGERGYSVDVKPMTSAGQLGSYDAFVLGSAINGGQWLPEAVQFVERNASALGAKPVAAFAVHGMNAGDDEKQTAKRLAYLDAVRKHLTLADEGYFLGDMGKMGGIATLAFKAFGGAGEGDMRDWDAIRTWAEAVAL